jgi:hypothetical protein
MEYFTYFIIFAFISCVFTQLKGVDKMLRQAHCEKRKKITLTILINAIILSP